MSGKIVGGAMEQSTGQRVTGDAAWRAHRDELERRNESAKREAHEHVSTQQVAAVARERRLARAEELQLEALNQRIADGRARG